MLSSEALLRECRRERYQGSGPGGQKRNRVLSGVRLLHNATALRAESSEHRQGERNVAAALIRLRLEMAIELGRCVLDQSLSDIKIKDLLSLEAHRFRLASSSHPDYPICAGLALISFAAKQGRVADASKEFKISGSAFTRFLRADKKIWAFALELRQSFHLGPLKEP